MRNSLLFLNCYRIDDSTTEIGAIPSKIQSTDGLGNQTECLMIDMVLEPPAKSML